MAAYNKISQITESLFLSDLYGASNVSALQQRGITCVINITVLFHSHTPFNSGVEHVRIPVRDSQSSNIEIYFDFVADKIHQVSMMGRRTLIHCLEGKSRSPSFVIAYLMKYRGMTLADAFHLVRSQRPFIHPNGGFWRQLAAYEWRLFGRNSVMVH